MFHNGLGITCYPFLLIKSASAGFPRPCVIVNRGVKVSALCTAESALYKPSLTHFPRHGIAQPSLALEMSLLPSDDSCMMKRELKPGSQHGCVPRFLPHPMLFEGLGGGFFYYFFFLHCSLGFFFFLTQAPGERGFESESVTKLWLQHQLVYEKSNREVEERGWDGKRRVRMSMPQVQRFIHSSVGGMLTHNMELGSTGGHWCCRERCA